jgi:hypothetical protein
MNPSTPQPDFCLLLDQQQSATVLSLLGDGELAPQLGAFKAEALVMLDRVQEANDTLDPLVMQMQGWEMIKYGWHTMFTSKVEIRQ